MPSGSHGGSGGSHSSGGSSFGGHSSHGGSFSSRPRGPMHFRWGRRVYVLPQKQSSIISKFIPWIVLSVFFAIFSSILLTSANYYLKKIRRDYDYYQDMIAVAEADENYIRTGYATDHFYNDDCGKWYFTYKIARDDSRGAWLEGYTYSCYTREEIKNYPIDSTITIVVNSKVVTDKTDSIPLHYKDMSIERDGEYTSNLKSKRIALTLVIISGLTFTTLIVVEIRLVVKYKQPAPSSTSNNNPTDTTANKSTTPNTKVFKRCEYCGKVSKDENAEKCPNCGAKLE